MTKKGKTFQNHEFSGPFLFRKQTKNKFKRLVYCCLKIKTLNPPGKRSAIKATDTGGTHLKG